MYISTRYTTQTLLLLLIYATQYTTWGQECHYPQINTFKTAHLHTTYQEETFPCVVPRDFSARILNETLFVYDCPSTIKWSTDHKLDVWKDYTSPVLLDSTARFAYVTCGDSKPLFLVRPARIDPLRTPQSERRKNIMVVMLDALSYENLHRTMPMTLNVLNSESQHTVTEYNMYSTVGLNSYPNKFQLFGGYDYQSVVEMRDKGLEVNLTWIWEQVKELGYTTAIAEGGCPNIYHNKWNLFNVPVNGFPISSVGVHNPPDNVLIDQLCASTRTYDEYCIEGQWGHNYAKKYVTELVEDLSHMPENERPPLFLFSNFVEAHTAPQWGTAILDRDVAEYLNMLMRSPLMDNGVIFFLSDHGAHFGHYPYSSIFGMAENRHPLLFSIVNKQFQTSPLNANQLVTPMDVHYTLQQLAGLPALETSANGVRFYNLLNEQVPKDRTCERAGIPSNRCLCTYKDASAYNTVIPPPTQPASLDTCDHATVPDYLWNLCVNTFAHPNVFDWQYYLKESLFPIIGGEKIENSECFATLHWCTYGLALGLAGSSDFNPATYLQQTPALQQTEYCFSWPNTYDCRWSMVLHHYIVTNISDVTVPSPQFFMGCGDMSDNIHLSC